MADWRELPNAPAAGTPLGSVDQIRDQGAREVVFGEGEAVFKIVLLRRGDEVWAYRNRCPHYSLALNYEPDNFLTMDGEMIVCAHHTAFFRFEDGYCFEGPCRGAALEAIPLRRTEAALFVGPGPSSGP